MFRKVKHAARIKNLVPDSTGGNAIKKAGPHKPGQKAVEHTTEALLQGGWNLAEDHKALQAAMDEVSATLSDPSISKPTISAPTILEESAILEPAVTSQRHGLGASDARRAVQCEGDAAKDKQNWANCIMQHLADNENVYVAVAAGVALATVSVGGYLVHRWWTKEEAEAGESRDDATTSSSKQIVEGGGGGSKIHGEAIHDRDED
jgi:hypothetical protein